MPRDGDERSSTYATMEQIPACPCGRFPTLARTGFLLVCLFLPDLRTCRSWLAGLINGRLVLVLWVGCVLSGGSRSLMAARGELELRVLDADTQEPVAVQMQLLNQRGLPVKPPGLVRDGDWLVFDGPAVLTLPPGDYSFRLRRGLEYRERTGNFDLQSGAADSHTVSLPRFVDMAKEGWYSGDLQFQPASLAGLVTRIRASDLALVPIICRDNQGVLSVTETFARQIETQMGRDRRLQWPLACDRRQGSVAIFWSPMGLPTLPAASEALPTSFDIARILRAGASNDATPHVHLAHVCSWDLPVWVAHSALDTVGLMHDGVLEESSRDAPQDRPRDPVLFPDPEGVGRWSQQTYFQLLETGIRLPPAAGSGADASGNPLGLPRVYVHCGDAFSPDAWWDGLRAGRVVVTNGPLIRPRINGQLPGHVFQARTGQTLQLQVELKLSTADKIRYLEIIYNGRPAQQVRLEDWAANQGRLPPIVCQRSGWVLVRVVAEHPTAFRSAVSGPFYVEFDDRPRISRQACQFFLDWVYQRARQIKLPDPQQREALLLQHRVARDFWQGRCEAATVD